MKRESEKETDKLKQPKRTDANILLAERKIEENLGLVTKINNKKNSSGKITIEYNNLDQFEMLSNLLTKK